MKTKFTHKLKYAVPSLNLKKGTLMQVINPFSFDIALCFDKRDLKNHCRNPWIFYFDDLEPLPEWPRIRQEMIDAITKRAGWKTWTS